MPITNVNRIVFIFVNKQSLSQLENFFRKYLWTRQTMNNWIVCFRPLLPLSRNPDYLIELGKGGGAVGPKDQRPVDGEPKMDPLF
jgi:hypothetical protein